MNVYRYPRNITLRSIHHDEMVILSINRTLFVCKSPPCKLLNINLTVFLTKFDNIKMKNESVLLKWKPFYDVSRPIDGLLQLFHVRFWHVHYPSIQINNNENKNEKKLFVAFHKCVKITVEGN